MLSLKKFKESDLPRETVVAVTVLQEWVNNQAHLLFDKRNSLLTKLVGNEADLLLFLEIHEFNVENAKIHINNFCTMRTHLPEFFADRDPRKNEMLNQCFKTVSIIPLEKRTINGYKVILSRLIDFDHKRYVFEDAIKYLNMVLDLCVHEEGTSDGYVILIDLHGANMAHSTRLTALGLRKFITYIDKAAPIKWKGLHYFGGTDKHLNNFLQEHVVAHFHEEPIFIHVDVQDIIDRGLIERNILPEEYNGEAGKIEILRASLIRRLKNNSRWFIELENCFSVDESQRTGQPLNAEILFENI